MALNPTNLFIQAAPLPATFRGTPNDFFSEMIQRMKILSPSGTNFIFIGDTEPTSNVGPWLKNGTKWYVFDPAIKRYVPADITASFTEAFVIGNTIPSITNPPVWLRTTLDNSNATAPNYGDLVGLFTFDATLSQWLAPNPTPPGSPERKIWTGVESSAWAYDGGDGTDPSASTPTATTGAMWEVDHTFDFCFPIGVGTNVTTYNAQPASTVGIGNTGGEEQHKLLVAEQGAAGAYGTLASGNIQYVAPPGMAIFLTDATNAHNNMPPYRGVFFIKRTARKFYTP